MTAVLIFVFQDPILGLVASIQLAANKMVKPGDWITVPKFNIDGTVEDISLTTVKIKNFDMTITTIPTYSLVVRINDQLDRDDGIRWEAYSTLDQHRYDKHQVL